MSPDEEHAGPFAVFEDMCRALGPEHPYNAETFCDLHWYDGPIYSVMTVPGDSRPRLDVMVDDHHEGDDATRIFTSVRHQLVFDRMETLEASLRMGCPTPESYRLAEYIIRYRSRTTRIGHPEPSHEMWTSRHRADTLPPDELPDPGEPDGMAVPGRKPIKKEKRP